MTHGKKKFHSHWQNNDLLLLQTLFRILFFSYDEDLELFTFLDAPMTICFTVVCTDTLTSHNASLTSCCHSELEISTFGMTVSVQASTLTNITSISVFCSHYVNLFLLWALFLTCIVVVGWTGAFTPRTSKLICEAKCHNFSFFLTFRFAVRLDKLRTVTFAWTLRICIEVSKSISRFTLGLTLWFCVCCTFSWNIRKVWK